METPSPEIASAIQVELDRIGHSSVFIRSDRLMQFLRFVCNELIAGRAHRLSQYTVAVEALGQDASFDPGTDALVRVEARRLRMKLLEFYDVEGRTGAIRLGLPKGQYAPVVETVADAKAGPPLPSDVNANVGDTGFLERPAVAVLPFNNLSNDQAQDFFADGLTEDIITGLAAFRCVPVIGRHSSFAFRGTGVCLKTVARELGAQYVVEGSIRRAGDRLRINAQLVDARLDHHLWAQRFDSPVQDMFAVQDEITEKIVTHVVPEFLRAEIEHSVRKRSGGFGYWEELNRGIWHLNHRDEHGNREARVCFKHAVALNSMQAPAYTWLSLCELFAINRGWSGSPATAVETALNLSSRAAALDPADADSRRQLSVCLTYRGRHGEALEEAKQSIALNPSSCEAHYALALAACFSGDLETSLLACQKCLRLNPIGLYLAVIYSTTSLIHLMAHDFATAADEARKAIRIDARSPRGHHRLALSLAHAGNLHEAAVALEAAKTFMPGPTREFLETTYPFAEAKDFDFIVDGLRKCGWAET